MSGPAWPDEWWTGAHEREHERDPQDDRQDPDTVETRWERAREHEQHEPENVRAD